MFTRRKEYKVSLRGRSGVIYTEGEKSLLIDAEMLAGNIDFVIYMDSIKHWLPPHEEETISLDEKNKIIANTTTALERKGLTIEWE